MQVVTQQSQQVGITTPQVAIYHAPDINAFATGAEKKCVLSCRINRLVAKHES